MADKQVQDTGNGAEGASEASASGATAASSTPSPKRRKSGTQQTSPVEALEILTSAFNQAVAAGIPGTIQKSHDGQVLIYKIGARQCPLCKQPRPLWHFNGNICRECQP